MMKKSKKVLLQQYLPFTVLKRLEFVIEICWATIVATVLTVYGIETTFNSNLNKFFIRVATVLTVYGIETQLLSDA